MTRGLTSFEQRGLRRYYEKLDRMPDVVRRRIRGALEVGGADLVSTMKSLVPEESGELSETIEYYFPETRPGEQSYRGEQLSIKGSFGLAIVVVAGSSSQSGEDGFYAKFVEFGHVRAGAVGSSEYVPASPFFYPAYRFRRVSIRGRITRAMKAGISEVAGRGD